MLGWFRKSRPSTVKPIDAIGRLGELMEQYPSHVLDTSLLPMSKPQLKAALKQFWRAVSPAQRQALEVGYVSLANFQDGVGSKPISLALSDDPTLSKALSQWDATIAWMKRISEEQKLLFAEFDTFKQGIK
jgi:hypothetical protein